MSHGVIKIKQITSQKDLDEAHKIDIDYSTPPYPYDIFLEKTRSLKTYLMGAYLKEKNNRRSKLIGFILFKVKKPYGYEVLRLGSHFEGDDYKLFSEFFNILPIDNTIGKVDDYITIKVRAQNKNLCNILKANNFICTEIKANAYINPSDDMLIFTRGS